MPPMPWSTGSTSRSCRAAAGRCATLAGLTLCASLAAGASRVQAQGVLRDDYGMTARAAAAAARATAPVTPLAALNAPARTLRDSLVAFARAQVGRRYRMGGASPEGGFDCSGLVQYVLAAFELRVPRTAAQQSRFGQPVARDTAQLRPGDLLTFGGARRTDHVGIYVGGGRFVHASSVAGRVIESRVNRRPARLIKPWRGARRLALAGDTLCRLVRDDAAPGGGCGPRE